MLRAGRQQIGQELRVYDGGQVDEQRASRRQCFTTRPEFACMHKILADGGSFLRVQTWDVGAPVPTDVEGLLRTGWPTSDAALQLTEVSGTVICVASRMARLRRRLPARTSSRSSTEQLGGPHFGSRMFRRLCSVSKSSIFHWAVSKGCSLDLGQRRLLESPGRAVQAVGANPSRRIAQEYEKLEFECVITARSQGEYFRAWLDDAALEFLGQA